MRPPIPVSDDLRNLKRSDFVDWDPIFDSCALLESVIISVLIPRFPAKAGIPSQDSMKSGPAGNMGQLPQLQASAPLSTPDSGLLTAEKKKELGNGLRAAISG